jgi:hypothetical protein
MEKENQQLLPELESSLEEHIRDLEELRARCGKMRNEAAQHFVEYANHRCVAGEPKALGLQLIAGADVMRLVAFSSTPLAGFYRELEIAFDSATIGMIKDFDGERAAVLILQEAVQEIKKRIRTETTARKASAVLASTQQSRTSLVRNFLAAGRAIKFW